MYQIRIVLPFLHDPHQFLKEAQHGRDRRRPILPRALGIHSAHAQVTLFHFHLGTVMAASTILFEDIFDVKDIDQDGKKFERGLYFIDIYL